MPEGKSLAADSVGGLVSAQAINNPKRINVREVSNGFIVDLTNKRDWNERTSIASTKAEVIEIITSYLSEE